MRYCVNECSTKGGTPQRQSKLHSANDVTALPATVRSCPALADKLPPALTVLAWLSGVCVLLFAVVLLVLSAVPVMLMSFSATSCRSLPAVSRAPVLLMS